MTIDTTNAKAPEVALLPRRRAELITPSRRHSRKCTVCHHPSRYLIELAFLRWTSPSIIARHFGINDRASIYPTRTPPTYLSFASSSPMATGTAKSATTRWRPTPS